MRTKILLIAAAIVSLASSANAMSLSIDGPDCPTCDGSDLFLEINDNDDGNFDTSGVCKNGGGTDEICTSGSVDITGGGDPKWEFTVPGGSPKTDPPGWQSGGQHANPAGLQGLSQKPAKGNPIAENGPAVPEPSSALLFGIGALVASRLLPSWARYFGAAWRRRPF